MRRSVPPVWGSLDRWYEAAGALFLRLVSVDKRALRQPVPVVQSLDKWYHATRKVVGDQANCAKLFGSPGNEYLRFKAWQGDKFLGAAAARVMEKSLGIQTSGDATQLCNKALSNRFLAMHAKTILPTSILQLGPEADAYNERQWGTLFESLIAHIENDESLTESQEAIDDLAEWLLREAALEKTIAFDSKLVLPCASDSPVIADFYRLGGEISQETLGGTPKTLQVKVKEIESLMKKAEESSSDLMSHFQALGGKITWRNIGTRPNVIQVTATLGSRRGQSGGVGHQVAFEEKAVKRAFQKARISSKWLK